MEQPPRPTLFDFHGVSMTKYFTDNWDNMSAKRQDSVPLHERVPFLEIHTPGMPSGVDELNKLTTSPRIFKTHLPVHFVPKSFWEQNPKIIYVARNAKDTAVSYFHFDRMNMVQPEPGDWSSFLQRFIEGKMVFGSWYDHVRGWWEKKQTCSNVLYLFYEDMIEITLVFCLHDTERELSRLCSFLGLSPTAEMKKQVTEKVLFDNMRKNQMVNGSLDEVFDFKISPFMRKGKVGDWRNHFTVAQNELFDEDYKKKMNNTDLEFHTVL
ncbi:cytosolic sulfotransferase 2-like [Scomber scombrus]|uniref:Sulfotransferase n=1 Tax=Scomber scombrus TaxID=13677 RepID=A0AAV1NEB1_SCOSC